MAMADPSSYFHFPGPGVMAYDAEMERPPTLMTTISPDQHKLLLTLLRVDSSVKAKVMSVITSNPHMMFRFERLSGDYCFSEVTSLSFSVVEGGQPAVADTVRSLAALLFRKEQDMTDLGESNSGDQCARLPTEEECRKELATNGRFARKLIDTFCPDEEDGLNEVSFTSHCIQNSAVRRKILQSSLLGKFLAPLGEDMIFGRSETAVHARKVLKLLTVFLGVGDCEHSRLTTPDSHPREVRLGAGGDMPTKWDQARSSRYSSATATAATRARRAGELTSRSNRTETRPLLARSTRRRSSTSTTTEGEMAGRRIGDQQ